MVRTATKSKRCLPAKSSQRKKSVQLPSPTQAPAVTRILRSHTKANLHEKPATSSSKIVKPKPRRKRLDPWYPKRRASKDPRARAPQITHFTCRICISYLPKDDFVRWIPPRRWYGKPLDAPRPCIPHLARSPYRRHIDPVCKTCVGSFMAAQLDMLGARKVGIGCLEPGCSNTWPMETVVKYFPLNKLEAYNLAAFEHWRTNTDLFTCLSPICSFIGLLDPDAPGYPQVECPISTCRARSCATCCTPWHEDQTCAEIRSTALNAQMSESERETLALMQSKDGKRCPNCQLVIEKDGGCPSMFCPGCKTFFDWDAAASALPGSRKAMPIMTGHGHWQPAIQAVCEVDGPRETTFVRTFERNNMHWMLAGCQGEIFGGNMMPLPDEDDADL